MVAFKHHRPLRSREEESRFTFTTVDNVGESDGNSDISRGRPLHDHLPLHVDHYSGDDDQDESVYIRACHEIAVQGYESMSGCNT